MAVRVIPRYAGEQLSFDTCGVLFFGDNRDVLRRHVAPNCVDLVYLDPPFNSNRAYNMVFKHSDGEHPAAAQEWAFDDMWRWDTESVRTFDEIVAWGKGGAIATVGRRRGRVDFPGNSDIYTPGFLAHSLSVGKSEAAYHGGSRQRPAQVSELVEAAEGARA